ncbi:MAG: hypothetical protein KDI55_02300 [Anaerolineae bacterium]|nr:hypothetical protein [Anaerolineae bacterium]MCP5428568.1 hypothetical protein [Chromatiaceae bacterium]
MKNIEDLREHLFATLDALRDKNNPMDTDRAKAIADVAQTIINSAKVEIDHIRATEAIAGTGFIPDKPRQKKIPASAKELVNRSWMK